jgi:hypothetical protein
LAVNNKRFNRSRDYTDYDETIERMSRRHDSTNDRQPGNPEVAVTRIVDAVRREGPYNAMTSLPLRIVLGSDAVAILRSECETMLQELQQFESIAATTDYPDAEVESYK